MNVNTWVGVDLSRMRAMWVFVCKTRLIVSSNGANSRVAARPLCFPVAIAVDTTPVPLLAQVHLSPLP